MQWPEKTVEIQQLNDSLFEDKGITVSMLREDLLHPDISGNKWRCFEKIYCTRIYLAINGEN